MSIPHHSTHLPKLNRLLRTSASRTDIADELGLTPSAVTQLVATPAVQASIASSKQETAAADAQLDESYDRIERTLLTQLERTVPLLMRPREIADVLTKINGAKRRGGPLKSEPAQTVVLQLNLPVAIKNKFVLNQANQVVSAGSQDLVTLPSANVTKLLEQKANHALPPTAEEDEYGFTHTTGTR